MGSISAARAGVVSGGWTVSGCETLSPFELGMTHRLGACFARNLDPPRTHLLVRSANFPHV